jgi:hypothetical protein
MGDYLLAKESCAAKKFIARVFASLIKGLSTATPGNTGAPDTGVFHSRVAMRRVNNSTTRE